MAGVSHACIAGHTPHTSSMEQGIDYEKMRELDSADSCQSLLSRPYMSLRTNKNQREIEIEIEKGSERERERNSCRERERYIDRERNRGIE